MDKIYIVGEGGGTTALDRVNCRDEDKELQSLLAKNLNMLPGEQFGYPEDLRWLIIKREMPVPSPASGENLWSLDFLLLDHFGVPTFVECKRHKNTQSRREIVGQLLEYASNGRHYWSADVLRRAAEETAGGADLLSERVSELRRVPTDVDEFFTMVDQNLQEARLRLIFFLEHSSPELRSIVEFLNAQMESTEVFIVEAQQYETSHLRVVAPRVFGYTEAARRAKRDSQATVVRNASLDGEETFWSSVEQNLAGTQSDAVRRLVASAQTRPEFEIRFMKSCLVGLPGLIPARSLLSLWRTGQLQLELACWNKSNFVLEHAQTKARSKFVTTLATLFETDPEELMKKSYPQFKPDLWVPHAEEIVELLSEMAQESHAFSACKQMEPTSV